MATSITRRAFRLKPVRTSDIRSEHCYIRTSKQFYEFNRIYYRDEVYLRRLISLKSSTNNVTCVGELNEVSDALPGLSEAYRYGRTEVMAPFK